MLILNLFSSWFFYSFLTLCFFLYVLNKYFFQHFVRTNVKGRRTCLITGGSSGIGFSLAKLFCEDGYNIVLVSRKLPQLEESQRALLSINSNIKVRVYSYDLSDVSSPARLFEELRRDKVEVDILVNNAGFGYYDYFINVPPSSMMYQNMIDCNVSSVVRLTQLLLPGMIRRSYGKILFVSSIVGMNPCSLYAVYSATKSFIDSFCKVLRFELNQNYRAITVTNLIPGSTYTNFSKRANSGKSSRIKMKPDDAAMVGYRGLFLNKSYVIAGFWNNVFAKYMPSSMMLYITTRDGRKKKRI